MKYLSRIVLVLSAVVIGSPILSQRNPRGYEMNWKTDTTQSTIPLDEIFVCIGKDDIPAIDEPTYYMVPQAEKEYLEFEPLIFVEFNMKAKAYPLSVLLYHEIVNDSIVNEGDTLFYTVTYCPLCNSAMVFNRKHEMNGKTMLLDFGVTGMLRNSDMVMYDRQTESWWQQFTGEGIVGQMKGQELEFIAAPVITMEEFSLFFPDGCVLSKENDHLFMEGDSANYGVNPYEGYDSSEEPFLYDGKVDPRFKATERVIDITVAGKHKIYHDETIKKNKVINDEFMDQNIVIFYQDKIISVLDEAEISESKTIGGVTAFFAKHKNKSLTFKPIGDGMFQDNETKSKWNMKGRCVEGRLKGEHLQMIVHGNHFAFAMMAFHPDCEIYTEK